MFAHFGRCLCFVEVQDQSLPLVHSADVLHVRVALLFVWRVQAASCAHSYAVKNENELFCFVLFSLQLSVCLWWHDYRRDDFPTLKFGVVLADLLAIC